MSRAVWADDIGPALVSEDQVVATIAGLPNKSFLRSYVQYGAVLTDAPMCFHLSTGLGLLAMVAQPDFTFRFAGTQYPNYWGILLGNSRESRKTTALKVGAEIARGVCAPRIGTEPGSVEGLIESLLVSPTQLLLFYEMGDLMAKSMTGSYFSAIRETLTKAYDCVPLERRLAKKVTLVPHPRLSILGGITPDYLESYSRPQDFTGGFLARFLFMAAERERVYAEPQDWPSLRELLTNDLRLLLHVKPVQFEGFSVEALDLWRSWYAHTEQRFDKAGHHRFARSAAFATAPMALKVAHLLALDIGAAREGEDWMITTPMLAAGIQIAEMHLQSVLWAVDTMSSSLYGKQRKVILELLGGGPREIGALIARTKIEKKRMHEILSSLEEEGAIVPYRPPNSPRVLYRLPGEVPENVYSLSDLPAEGGSSNSFRMAGDIRASISGVGVGAGGLGPGMGLPLVSEIGSTSAGTAPGAGGSTDFEE